MTLESKYSESRLILTGAESDVLSVTMFQTRFPFIWRHSEDKFCFCPLHVVTIG